MNIVLLGAGAMAAAVAEVIASKPKIHLQKTIEPKEKETLEQLTQPPHAVIDFSHPDNLEMLVAYCIKTQCPAVIATTGYTPAQQSQIATLAKQVPVVYAANFSLGIAIMSRVLEQITPLLEQDFDMELIEKHHNQKLDAPSGTAKRLEQAMNKNQAYEKVYGRYGNRKRGKEIGIHAIRGGTIAGEHTAIYAGEDEILEITHKAGSKKIFALGALKAAAFVQDAKPGLYTIEDVLGF